MMEIFDMTNEFGWDVSEAIRLTGALGAKSFRLVINADEVMRSPTEMKPERKDNFTRWIAELQAAGVTQIVGMSGTWFQPPGLDERADYPWRRIMVPAIDDADGSDYRRFMETFEETWYTLVSNFPQVTHWEMGNETNHAEFLKPLGKDPSLRFTREEHARISIDMMYYANRGIKRANPGAVAVMPALAPVRGIADMAVDLDLMYAYIAQGYSLSGSTDKRGYFDALAWHPYVDGNGRPCRKWVRANNEVYAVAREYGDDGVKVFFTEFGWPDGGGEARDRKQAKWFRIAYKYAEKCMPYVEAMHVYCLLEYAEIEGFTWGVFKVENGRYAPKRQAYAIQSIFGGTGSLSPGKKGESL